MPMRLFNRAFAVIAIGLGLAGAALDAGSQAPCVGRTKIVNSITVSNR